MSSVPQIIRRRRSRRQQKNPGPVLWGGISAVVVLAVLVVIVVGTVAAVSAFSYLGITAAIPADPTTLVVTPLDDAQTLLLDRAARQIIYRVDNPLGEAAPWLALDDVPDHVWQAAVAAQDGSFFERPAFSVVDLLRAGRDAIFAGQVNINDPVLLYLAQEVLVPLHDMPLDDPDRPLTDAVLIMELRRRFTREELLTWFLNTALYGNGAYGLEAAAQFYLGKAAAELTLAEAALLAGIPAAPTNNPFDHPDAAYERQGVVLNAMAAYGMITADEAVAADVQIAITRPLAPNDVVVPHFVLAARRQAEVVLNEAGYDGARLVAAGGLRITTALDLDLQYQAECALRTHITRLSGVDPAFVYSTAIGEPCTAADYLPDLAAADVGVPHAVSNGAVVITQPGTGQVLAYVGSIDYWNEAIGGQVDSAAAPYAPGTMLAPYVYLTALAQGYTPASMTLDVPETVELPYGGLFVVENADGEHRGPISLRQGLVESALPPAVQVLNWVGMADVLRTAHRMGLNTLDDGALTYDLSLLVEGGGLALVDAVYSFGVFANDGRMVGTPVQGAQLRSGFRALDPVFVLRIEDAAGNLLWEAAPSSRDTLAPSLAYLMNDMMGDRELRAQLLGADNVYEIQRPAAVHGGGAADGSALWTVGYTPQFSAGVWLGNTDGAAADRLTAESGPAPVWHAVMRYLHERDALPPSGWTPPPDVVELPVCEVSGLLPTEYCPVTVEVFAAGTEPVQEDYFYQMVEVNRQNGKRATASTPADLVEQRVYFLYPEEAQAWAEAAGIQGPPTEYDSLGPPVAFGPVAVLSPDPLSYVRGVIELRGNATLPDFQYYQLAYGQGLNPAEWTQIGERIYTPARGALLGQWETTTLPDGLYSLRLTVVTTEQVVEESIIQVTLDNTPPEIAITTPEEGATLAVSGTNPVIEVGISYSDGVGVEEVTFYLDGEPAVMAIEPPFSGPVMIDSLGQHSVWAEAVDAAGNTTLSERVTFIVRRE